jgi:hypothetical protein
MGPDPRRPALIAHADWGATPGKRWIALAARGDDGRFTARAPEPVGALDRLLERLAAEARGGSVLLGLDLPIGLPRAYARRAAIPGFTTALCRFGAGKWVDFYRPAATADELGLRRPFYPQRPGGASQRALLDRLGLTRAELLRRCDARTGGRPAACALFWTLGPSQVGKAAISAWRELLAPALRDGVGLAIWPFDGPLARLLALHRLVVVETYPAEVYRHLDLPLARRGNGRKSDPRARAACAPALLGFAERASVRLEAGLEAAIRAGLGDDRHGEDRFDAVVGLFGMLDVVQGGRPSGEPDDAEVLRIEGWILGQQAGASASLGGAAPGG